MGKPGGCGLRRDLGLDRSMGLLGKLWVKKTAEPQTSNCGSRHHLGTGRNAEPWAQSRPTE